MDYEWDSAKGKANARKHGVDSADAAVALPDDSALTISDPDSEGEDRLVSLGIDPNGPILVTVFTPRADSIRIIPSRKASRAGRRQYEEGR